MSKSKIISLIILALIILAIGSYFLFFNQKLTNKEVRTEDLLAFNNQDEKLSQATLDKYFQEFTWAKDNILKKTATFETNSWLTIARLKKYMKDYAGAEQVYLYVLKRDTVNYIPEANLADLYGNYLNNWEKAVEHYWAAVNKSGENKQVALNFYRNLADIYASKLSDKKSEFENKAEIVLNNDYSQSVDFLTMLAKYYKDIDDKNKAISYLERALTLNPANAQIIRDEIAELKK